MRVVSPTFEEGKSSDVHPQDSGPTSTLERTMDPSTWCKVEPKEAMHLAWPEERRQAIKRCQISFRISRKSRDSSEVRCETYGELSSLIENLDSGSVNDFSRLLCDGDQISGVSIEHTERRTESEILA